MKRWISWLVTTVLLVAMLAMTASADLLQEKTFVYNGARWPSSNTDVVTFWEAPMLNAGEAYEPGQLTFQNTTDEPVTLTLTKMGLPYDNKEQLAYLDSLRLVIRQKDTVVYDGAYARLTQSETPVWQIELQPGESRVYTMSLSCPFTYSQTISQYPVITWTFDSSMDTVVVTDLVEEPEVDNGFEWPLTTQQTVAAVCGVIGVGLLVTAIVLFVNLMRKRSKAE